MKEEFGSATPPLKKLTHMKKNLLALIAIFIACPTCLYLAEVFPRYLQIPVHSPEYYKGKQTEEWDRALKIIFLSSDNPFPPVRHFGYRLEAYVPENQLHDITSGDKIVSYFDKELDRLGWKQSKEPGTCADFLAEGNFLGRDTGEIVSYRRNDYNDYADYDENDLVCLAVWRNSEYGFNIVLLSMRSSFITMLVDFFF
jgi:hypothetical protein